MVYVTILCNSDLMEKLQQTYQEMQQPSASGHKARSMPPSNILNTGSVCTEPGQLLVFFFLYRPGVVRPD